MLTWYSNVKEVGEIDMTIIRIIVPCEDYS